MWEFMNVETTLKEMSYSTRQTEQIVVVNMTLHMTMYGKFLK